ncbi:class III lanthionine synthetase LanKC [Solwaraspora sp. WMMD406]|uniref:class III lanthionine synthetase LanKC n=1 Tax=Solwaraspora sp. WMMD406 TaxID=3016095 RepID=UPI002417D262|nr:class III lanthionine synthetase LanKC [Solwaraspora sp. WMMD406]MDG4766102.1 class III lanthionine synthetase LanKC [Solwaraspora sp. WMMD406]
MDEGYDAYCAVDPLFYDSLATASAPAAEFVSAGYELPEQWRREPKDDWLIFGPTGDKLPDQGWKIHISATLDNAEDVLRTVREYCLDRGLPFKCLRGPRMLLMRNAKYAPRGSSGKFVTIYPHDDAEFELACKELADALDGEPGPHILSDLRYGAGPVHVRYGGFAARYCLSDDGQVVAAIAAPDGTLVPDRRDPVFRLPDWVTLPDFLTPHLAARNATSTTDLPYRVDRVIHFSNGGGIYAARDTRTDRQVVLKEARPHAGLDGTGADAVARLRHEAQTLRQLAGIPHVPEVLDEFALGEHRFVALEFIDGQPLNRILVRRYPLIDADAPAERFATYTAWALRVYDQVRRAIDDIHARGVVYGDLHLFNVMVRDDDTVALVDFEVAQPLDATTRPALRNQGFAAPRDRIGPAVDRYALACLKLALFLPLTQLVRLVPAKATDLADVIRAHFPVPSAFLDDAVAEITATPVPPTGTGPAHPATTAARPALHPTGAPTASTPPVASTPPTAALDPTDWAVLRRQMTDAIAASATPHRDDRLHPGDIAQFRSGGLNLANGAAGVLWALAESGGDPDPDQQDWLIRRASNPPSGSRYGFYDGLHGVAFALDRLGHHAPARDLLGVCLDEPWQQLGPDLFGGLSGIALNLLHFAARTGDTALGDAAWQAVRLVADRLDADDRTAPPDGDGAVSGGRHPYAGLTRGRSGPALMFLRAYELTGDTGLLDRAEAALRWDLRRCVVRDDGALEVNEGWRTMPYLAHGSVGIGIVVDQYLRHRATADLADAATAIRRAARSPFYAQSGLFAGRAGIIAYLAARTRDTDGQRSADDDRAECAAQLRRLAWHAMPYQGALAFPGEQLLRLSMDLATGTAGVLLAAATALRDDQPVGLPFLAPITGAHVLPALAGATPRPASEGGEEHGAPGSSGHGAAGGRAYRRHRR